MEDALSVDSLLSEWFDWRPHSGRLDSIRRAVRNRELLLAAVGSRIIGFIHYVKHEDIIDGAPNSFISAFFVTQSCRRKGVGTMLLEEAIKDSFAKGARSVLRPQQFTLRQENCTKGIISNKQWETSARFSSNSTSTNTCGKKSADVRKNGEFAAGMY